MAVALACSLVVGELGSGALAADDDVARKFDAFCQSWMEKLAVREADNLKGIAWKQNGSGVEGEYIGYSKEHQCDLKAQGEVPIGKVTYREHRYRLHRASPEAASDGSPEITEITEITEIFRYGSGKWIY